MVAPRRIEKFTSRDGADVVDFSELLVSARTSQGLRAGQFYAAGQHYPSRTHGYAPSLKMSAREELMVDPFGDPLVVDAAVDELRSLCYGIGLGQLWTIDDAAVLRWAWAALVEMPASEMGPFTQFNMPLAIAFERFSDWFSEDPVTGSQALASGSVAFDINNAGDAKASAVTFRLRANATGGFANNPTLSNARGSQALTIALDAVSANAEVRIRNDDNAIDASTDNGATYADAYDLATLADDQVALMEIHRGVNPMTYSQDSGTPDAVIEWSYYEAFLS